MLLLFDFDGTLADSLTLNIKIANELAPRFGFREIKPAEIETIRGMSAKEVMSYFRIPFYKLPFLVRAYYGYQSSTIPKPVPGIKSALQTLKNKGYVLGIISSNSEKRIRDFLKKYELPSFDFIHSEKSFFGKDRAITRMVRKLRIPLTEVLYIGDEVRDIEAARKAKVKIMAVTWGFNTRALLQKYRPDFLIDKPVELVEITSP